MITDTSKSIGLRAVDAVLHPTTHIAKNRQAGSTVFTRAEGIHIWDDQGNKYIEGMAGLWCTSVGYGNKELADAAAEQISKLSYSHMFGGKAHEPAVLLAEKLKEIAPFQASKVFFGHSGSDANDTQIKLIWYYNNAIGRPQKKKIIGRHRAYHGVGFGSGSATGLAQSHVGFDIPFSPFLRTACPHYYREGLPGESESEFTTRLAKELEELILAEGPASIAAFIAEPIMGAGGVVVPPMEYFEKIQAVLTRHDILLIDDEVICGFGRTGNMFGATTVGMRPDTMSVAKGISSGYQPISAVLIPEFMYDAFDNVSNDNGIFGHGYTYSGHPVCAAVALKNIEIIERMGLVANAAELGAYFQARLQEFASHPLVGEVRGAGLIAAVEFVRDKKTRHPFDPSVAIGYAVQDHCLEQGLIVRALGNSLGFCPPLIVTRAQVDEIIDCFAKALDATLAGLPAQHRPA